VIAVGGTTTLSWVADAVDTDPEAHAPPGAVKNTEFEVGVGEYPEPEIVIVSPLAADDGLMLFIL